MSVSVGCGIAVSVGSGSVRVGVRVLVGGTYTSVGVRVGVPVGTSVSVGVKVGLCVYVGDGVTEGFGVIVGSRVFVGDGVAVNAWVFVEINEFVALTAAGSSVFTCVEPPIDPNPDRPPGLELAYTMTAITRISKAPIAPPSGINTRLLSVNGFLVSLTSI